MMWQGKGCIIFGSSGLRTLNLKSLKNFLKTPGFPALSCGQLECITLFNHLLRYRRILLWKPWTNILNDTENFCWWYV